MKTCSSCHEEKPRSEFNRKTRSPDGLQTYCRDCDRAASAARYVTNREWYEERNRRRRALKTATLTDGHSVSELSAHFDELNFTGCALCGDTARDIHVDHSMPLYLGGTETLDNLVPLCEHHNTSKGARSPWEWYPAALRDMGDDWEPAARAVEEFYAANRTFIDADEYAGQIWAEIATSR